MKKLGVLLLLAGGLLLSSNGHNVLNDRVQNLSFEETVLDFSNSNGVSVKKAETKIGSYSASNTYVQVGQSLNGNYQLRFATAVKGEFSSVQYKRTVNDNTAVFDVTTVYSGLRGSDELGNQVEYYYTDEGLTTSRPDTIDYYWACYGAEFKSSKSLDLDFSVLLVVDEEEREAVVASVDSVKLKEGQSRVDVNHYDLDGTLLSTSFGYYNKNQLVTINAQNIDNKVANKDYQKVYIDESREVLDFYYSEVSSFDGVNVSSSLSGDGTKENPYLIQSGADLAYVRDVINDGTTTFKGEYLKLTKSIDLSSVSNFVIGEYVDDANQTGFAGNLDGNNCGVRGINIDNTVEIRGLFAQLIAGGTISNLSTYGISNLGRYAGGIVGRNLGSIINCTNYIDITSNHNGCGGITGGNAGKASLIDGCENYGTITLTATSHNKTGGITGLAEGTIKNCSNYGNVNGAEFTGGIAGESYAATIDIANCKNYGDISGIRTTGGIIGQVKGGQINDCINYGKVTSTSERAGGIAAHAYKNITNCVNNGEITLGDVVYAGGIAGVVYNDVTISNCTNNGNITTANKYVGGIVGTNGYQTTAYITNCTNNGNITSTNNGVGGILGGTSANNCPITNCTNNGNITGNDRVAGILGAYGHGDEPVNCTNNGVITATKNGGVPGDIKD